MQFKKKKITLKNKIFNYKFIHCYDKKLISKT